MSIGRTRRSLLGSFTLGIGLAGCFGDDTTPETADPDDAEQDTDSAPGTDHNGDEDDGNDEEAVDEPADDEDVPAEPDEELPDWMRTELEDVRTGETFSIAEFEGPVLLETFAVWCPDCLEQQHESRQFREQTEIDVESVSLNIDPNEDTDVVRGHVDDHEFGWYFAVAPGDMTRSLVDEFGDSIAHPPASPIVLICPNGDFRRLDDGLVSADTLEAKVSSGC